MLKRLGAPRGKVIPKEYFGMHLVSLTGWLGYTTPFPTGLGVGSVRLHDTGTTWRRMETTPGVLDFTRLDAIMSVLDANGVTDILFTLGQAPLSATGGIGPATGSYNPNPPTNIEDWKRYVTAMVTRYAGRIKYWEVWNEVNYPEFWLGTNAQLVQLTQEASAIIRAIDPAAIIVGVNTSTLAVSTSLPYMSGSNPYTDLDAIHSYGEAVQPELKAPIYAFMKAQQDACGLSRPLFNTEYTYNAYYVAGSLQTGDNNPMSEDMAASYAARLLLTQWLFGFARCYFYAFDNFGYNNIRLVSAADRTTLTKAGRAYSFIANLLPGGTLSSFEEAGKHYAASFSTKDGKLGRIFWCRDGVTDAIDLTTFSSVKDVEGQSVAISGAYVTGNLPIFCFY